MNFVSFSVVALVHLTAPVLSTADRGPTAAANSSPAEDLCDRSKCRSIPGIFQDGEYDCWSVSEDWKPAVCAKGYEVLNLSNVSKILNSQEGFYFDFFTCCPKGEEATSPMLYECTDTVCSSPNGQGGTDCWADAVPEPMTCQGDEFPFPRKTGAKYRWQSRVYWNYVCCRTDDGTLPLQKPLLKREWARLVLHVVALVSSIILAAAICLSRITRQRTFNVYLVFLAIPDITCQASMAAAAIHTLQGSQVSIYPYLFFQYFYVPANMWLNSIIVYEIYLFLDKSHKRIRLQQPSLKRICKQTAAVYLWASLVGVWATLWYSGDIAQMTAIVWEKQQREVAIWMLWIFAAWISILWLFCICFLVWKQNIFPRSSRTGVFALYFLRIIVVFIVFWLITVTLSYLEQRGSEIDNLFYKFTYLNSIQVMVSTAFALQKPDVCSAVVRLLTCRCLEHEIDHNASSQYFDGRLRRSLSRNLSSFMLWPAASAWPGRKPRPSATDLKVGISVLHLNTKEEGGEEEETSTRENSEDKTNITVNTKEEEGEVEETSTTESSEKQDKYYGNVLERQESKVQTRSDTCVCWKAMPEDDKVADDKTPVSPEDNADAV